MRAITVSSCNLNQFSLDFHGNLHRILQAVKKAKNGGSCLIITPELSICGYSCLDAFLEPDTELHSWEVLHELMTNDDCQNIIVDVGMPVRYASCLYNCRIVFFNQKILYVRPKSALANSGNFREMRYFTPWVRPQLERLIVPKTLRILTGQRDVPIGECVIQANDFTMANEMCEELFTPDAPSIHQGLSGVEVVCNSSASHWQLRKLDRRLELMQESSKKSGSLYIYANQVGCEGDARVYWDGCALILLNGEVLAQGSQFSLNDVEVISATADLDQLWGDAHSQPARRMQAAKEPHFPQIQLDMSFTDDGFDSSIKLTPIKEATVLSPEAEIGNATGAWMW